MRREAHLIIAGELVTASLPCWTSERAHAHPRRPLDRDRKQPRPWLGVPGLLGKIAFVQLRRILLRETQAAAICIPLAEPIETVQLPTAVGGKPS
jgi:hypothetical protein